VAARVATTFADKDMMETTQSRLTCNELFGGGAPARYWTAPPRHQ